VTQLSLGAFRPEPLTFLQINKVGFEAGSDLVIEASSSMHKCASRGTELVSCADEDIYRLRKKNLFLSSDYTACLASEREILESK
jgi:hypothetical protein